MYTLHHHPFCPHSRFIRLVLGEHGLDLRLVEERAWERREAFLALNPAGTTPVLIAEGYPAIPGVGIIAEYLDEVHGPERRRAAAAAGLDGRAHRGAPADGVVQRQILRGGLQSAGDRAHLQALHGEENGGGAPAADVIRAAKVNVRYHLAYIGWLAQTRNFLAGDRLTYADLAAAAHLSAIDYLGDVPWSEDDAAKAWYARVKSRPSFRPLLSEWLAGVPASQSYVDLDF